MQIAGWNTCNALPRAAFPAMRFHRRERGEMLLVSDGVVETRITQGELFEFEWAAKLSAEAAEKRRRPRGPAAGGDFTALVPSIAACSHQCAGLNSRSGATEFLPQRKRDPRETASLALAL